MKLQTRIKLPLVSSLGSLFFILLITALTDPLKNIIFVIFLYAVIFMFIASLYLLIARFQTDSRGGLKGALILSSILTVMLMLRSAKALNITDLALLIFFIFGLIFYFSRRA
jgi:hypothetical protein